MKKIKGRYQNKDRRVIDRKYMSYEDVPLQDYRDTEPMPKNLTKRFLKVFFILFLSVVLVLALMNIDNLTPDNISHWFQYDFLGKTEGNGYPVGFAGTNVSIQNFDLLDGVPAYCSDTSVVVLNSNAGEYQNSQHSFANPMMSVSSGYAIIYNIDATGFKVINREKTVYSGSTKNKIFSADVSSNGVYALLTHGNDYLANLTVYRNDNLEKYTYSFADYYVSKISLNKNGSRAVLSGVSAKNGGLISVIYVLDFSQDNYLEKYEFDDSYIYDVKFLNNGNAVAVGETAAHYINIDNNKKTDFSYDSRILTSYSLSSSYGMLLSLSNTPDGRECDAVMINADGKKTAEIKTEQQILSLDCRNNKIAVLFPNTTIVYDNDGKKLSTVKTSSDARKIKFVSDNSLYVLGKSRIFKTNIDY